MSTVRKVIEINEDLCNGCGDCIIGCPEGAIQLIDGKARLVSDTYCDGLGACVGECPVGAINVIERAAAPYDERLVIANILKQGPEAVEHHLEHLKDHGETEYLAIAMEFLKQQKPVFCGCPGSAPKTIAPKISPQSSETSQVSSLTHWPVQMHLINPAAPQFAGSDFLLAADCVAFSLGTFHAKYLKNRTLGIACPKLDQGQEIYRDKVQKLINDAKINTLTVMIMQVPCCQGLLRIAVDVARAAARKIPVKAVVVGVEGEILSEEWV